MSSQLASKPRTIMKDLKLNLILKAADGMTDVIKSACSQSDEDFKKLNKTLDETAGKFDTYGKRAAVMGGALLGASALNIKSAAEFEKGMNSVTTLIDTNTESISSMSKEVLNMAKNSPKAVSDFTQGLYSIRSAGISASDQFKVLHGSEMLSVAGLSSVAEAVDVTTSAINAFNLKGKEQNKVYDMLFKVVKYGKTDISQFAQGFGSSAGVVSAAEIELDEYSASVAAMTTSGLKAANAHTQIKAAVAGLSRGSKEQMKIFRQLGAKSFSDLVKKSGGMVNAFNRIQRAVRGNQSKLIGLVGSVQGYNAIVSLTGAQNKVYLQALNDMRKGSDSLTEAYNKQAAGLDSQIMIMKNSIQALSIEFGSALIPVVQAAGGAIRGITGVISSIPEGLKNFSAIALAASGAVLVFGGTGAMAIGSIIRNIIFLQKVARSFSIAAWANPALVPIIGISAAVIGLGAAAVYCYKKFEGFRNICQGTWAVVKAGGAWCAVLWNSFIDGAQSVWNFISPAVKFGLTIASWLHPIGLVYHAISGLLQLINNLAQKAGGFRGIGNAVKNWAGGAQKRAQEINQSVKGQRVRVSGSHAQGLDYVPYDGYIGELHKGEAVLTQTEADLWRGGNTQNTNNSASQITLNYSPRVTIQGESKSAKEDFKSILRAHKDEIKRLLEEIQFSQMRRAY